MLNKGEPFVNFEVDYLKKKKKKKKMMKKYSKKLIMCLKRLMTVAFGSSEPFHLENGRVRVNTIPT